MIWVGYAPPKSAAHGHGPRARNPRRAWEATQSFLRQHTVANLQSPLKLTVFGPSQWTNPSIVEAVRAEAARAFGPPTGISGDFHNWELPPVRLDEALEFAFADEDRPKQALGPVSLYLWFSFSWLKMPNAYPDGREHPHSAGSLGLSIGGRRMFIQPTFVFAASDRDREFVAHLRELEAAMPFVPNDTYYYRLEPKKSGKGSKLVKLAKGWKDAA